MSTFDATLTAVFLHGAEHRLELEDERATIAEAQYGSEEATLRLIYAYAPVLRNHVARHTTRIGAEEARSAAIAGLLEAIHAFDLGKFEGRLAGLASQHVAAALREVSSSAMPVEGRTLRRYRAILAAADGSFHEALGKVGDHGMTRETFVAVHEALYASSLSEEPLALDRASLVWVPADSAALTDADDAELLSLAWTAVGGAEADVIRHAYGFEDGEPHSDGEVAQMISERDLGEEAVAGGQYVMSRAKAQRIRTRGVDAMRTRVAGDVA